MSGDDVTISTASITDDEDDALYPLSDEELENYNNEDEEYKIFVPVPKARYERNQDLLPVWMMICRSINDTPSTRLLRVLFDSGGTGTMIHRSVLPKGCNPTVLDRPCCV